jgi:hypothetical protein
MSPVGEGHGHLMLGYKCKFENIPALTSLPFYPLKEAGVCSKFGTRPLAIEFL